MSTRWTYKIVEAKPQFLGHKPDAVAEVLNQHGLQGWELVSVAQAGVRLWLYLKKPAG